MGQDESRCAERAETGGWTMFDDVGIEGRASTGKAGLLALVALAAGCAAPDRGHEASVAQVRQHLDTTGTALVSVLLKDASAATAQADVAQTLAGTGAVVLHNFQTTPGMALELPSEDALELLASHPDVERFDLSASGGGGLDDSREIVG